MADQLEDLGQDEETAHLANTMTMASRFMHFEGRPLLGGAGAGLLLFAQALVHDPWLGRPFPPRGGLGRLGRDRTHKGHDQGQKKEGVKGRHG